MREEIVLGKVAEGATVRNLLTRFDGARVTDLEITVAGETVEPQSRQGERVTTLSFASPVSGELRYTVSYRVESADGVSKMPLLVPAYAGDETRAVTFTYLIPDGYHLQGSPYPVGIGSTGTQTRKLLGVPTFLDYRLGQARTGPLTSFNVIGATVIAMIIALTVLVFLREARAGRRGDSHV